MKQIDAFLKDGAAKRIEHGQLHRISIRIGYMKVKI